MCVARTSDPTSRFDAKSCGSGASSFLVPHTYDRELMKRGEAARRLIAEGEDPFAMLLAAVWPEHDWTERARVAHFTACPRCSDNAVGRVECGGTGLVTAAQRKLFVVEELAASMCQAA